MASNLRFLLGTRPGDDLSPRRRALFWGWNALLLVGAALALGIVSLALARGTYTRALFFDYLKSPALLALNLLPPLVMTLLLYGVLGRAWLAYLLTAALVLALSFGNYYKLTFRDDPVLFSDLLVLGEAGNMAGKYELFLSPILLAALAAALVSVALLALLARGRPRRPWRIGLVLAALALCAALAPVYLSDDPYEANANTAHINTLSATQTYLARGFLYPLLHSIEDVFPDPPEGYDQREMADLLARYEDADIPEDQKVNIVGVMLEAFADFSVYDQIEFRQDVYALWHQLEEESYSGRLLTNIFAGGTVNTERAFLTGMSTVDLGYRSNTNSYVWYFKSQGYQTSGDHPYHQWFYNRQNVDVYLGFDSYRFLENHYAQFSGSDTPAMDSIFFPQLTASVLEQVEDDAPLFSFSVSYQGHGPYSDSVCWWGEVDDYVGNDELSLTSRTILANYFGSQMDTQVRLMEMVEAFRASDEPIVLVVFGDHKPWLGNNSVVYSELGIDLTCYSVESFYNYYSTSYLIWANDAAKAALGQDFVGEGPVLSPCFLMNELFQLCGWEGDAYMQAEADIFSQFTAIHYSKPAVTADGTFVRVAEMDEDQLQTIERFFCLEYYRANHFSFGDAG